MNKIHNAEGQNSIAFIVKDQLCTGCGTCAGTCPQEAITMEIDAKKGIYIPQINEKCNDCGFCIKVCPGHEVDFVQLNKDIFGKEPDDILLGNYLQCYTGYSTDEEIRYNSSSGGMVTQLLLFALEQGIIDGALVTRMKKDKPLEPETFIARTREEIISARGSKYCPVPANIALREILNSKDNERFAVVGLPCHIHGLRKAALFNNSIRNKISFHLGLLCSVNRNFLAQDYLLKKYRIVKDGVESFVYKSEGNFGGLSIKLKNGVHKSWPYFALYNGLLQSYFIPWRCTLCCDHTNELADISLGDIWIPEFYDDKYGISSIIVRNGAGHEFIENAKEKHAVLTCSIHPGKVVQSQLHALQNKKRHFSARTKLLKLVHMKIPIYNRSLLSPRLNGYLYSLLVYLQISLSLRHSLWFLLAPFARLLLLASKAKQKMMH